MKSIYNNIFDIRKVALRATFFVSNPAKSHHFTTQMSNQSFRVHHLYHAGFEKNVVFPYYERK